MVRRLASETVYLDVVMRETKLIGRLTVFLSSTVYRGRLARFYRQYKARGLLLADRHLD